ncbi:MAG TPA: hypothetical protein VMF30_02195 [Pirellulales bacterium]|nr:hypothetical protein [Pirellulales bacterium]
MLTVFSLLTFRITSEGLSPDPSKSRRVVETTMSTVAGPMTGAISRGCQSCCLSASLQLLKFCAPVLLVGIFVQFIRLPANPIVIVSRIVLWSVGWFVWFGGGIASFLHALS